MIREAMVHQWQRMLLWIGYRLEGQGDWNSGTWFARRYLASHQRQLRRRQGRKYLNLHHGYNFR